MERRHPNFLLVIISFILLGLLDTDSEAQQPRTPAKPDALHAGRAALKQRDGAKAVTELEHALIVAPPSERRNVLVELRQAYSMAATQAEQQGKLQQAQTYRENLLIIDRAQNLQRSTPGGGPTRSQSDALPALSKSNNTTDDPVAPKHDDPFAPLPNLDLSDVSDPSKERATPGPGAQSELPTQSTPQAGEILALADAAFVAKDYSEAGRLYQSLAIREVLPTSHLGVWGYCRCVAVVARIKGGPESPQDWAEINAEIRAIRQLAPRAWYSEYLRRFVAEQSAMAPRPSRYLVPTSVQMGLEQPSDDQLGRWQLRETPNFRIFHDDEEIAERVAPYAESVRAILVRSWIKSTVPQDWQPKCDIYIYPDTAIYRQVTDQPSDSPGFSTIGLNEGRVAARRVNLRADHPSLVEVVLPHELAHIVLADLFSDQQLPRWVDEGLAVSAEPSTSRSKKADDLATTIASGRYFRISDLMTAEFPDGRYWDLFMAQSASVVEFLVTRESFDHFVQFVKASQKTAPEAALRSHYNFDGFDDLEAQWLAHVRGVAQAKLDGTDRDRGESR